MEPQLFVYSYRGAKSIFGWHELASAVAEWHVIFLDSLQELIKDVVTPKVSGGTLWLMELSGDGDVEMLEKLAGICPGQEMIVVLPQSGPEHTLRVLALKPRICCACPPDIDELSIALERMRNRLITRYLPRANCQTDRK